MRRREKFVTRRYGWWFSKRGDRVQAVEKCMGLKKGEKVKKICVIEIVDTQAEFVQHIDLSQEELAKEGFSDKSAEWFRELLLSMCPRTQHLAQVNRIEFRYVF